MDLSITVLNWNTSDLMVPCLQSITEHSDNLEYEVTVIDNGSTDADLRTIAEGFPSFRWIFNQDNRGGLALNEVRDSIRGRYFLFLSPDAQIQAGCLQEMVRFLDSHPEAGGVSGQLLNPDGSIQNYYRRLPTLGISFFCWTRLGQRVDTQWLNSYFTRRYKYEGLRLDSVVEVEQPAAPCFLVRRELVRDKNGSIVDPKFPFYFHDVHLCKRLYDAGYRVYVLPTARLIHSLGSSFAKRDDGWKRGENHACMLRYLFRHQRVWACLFYLYLVCETVSSLGFNYTRRLLASNNKSCAGRIEEGYQILSRIVLFLR